MIRLGNASSPRWYDISRERLDLYIEHLAALGASTAELVLHHGESDERTARVHVVEADWEHVFARYRAHGFVCHTHAPLHPRFKIDRFADSRAQLQAEYGPVFRAVNAFSDEQGSPCRLVLHASSLLGDTGRKLTADFLQWAVNQTGGEIALELRAPVSPDDRRFDRSRRTLLEFVEAFSHPRVGICWDLAHDWESSQGDPAWSATPDPRFLAHVRHVHLHQGSAGDSLVHHPLQTEHFNWRAMLGPLLDSGYDGAIIMEIRYRLAQALGEPWVVLGESYAMLSQFVAARASTTAP